MADLTAESLAGQPPVAGDDEYLRTKFDLAADTAIANETLHVDLDFFENPAALPLVPGVERVFADWLHRFCDFPEPEAASVAKRLPSYFAVALHDEWRSDSAKYAPLLQSLTGPFARAVQWEREWERYRLSLIKEFERPVFEERFPVSAIYVPLRAAYLESLGPVRGAKGSTNSSGGGFGDADQQKARTVIVDLQDALRHWLGKAEPSDTLRLIRGGPGSGKSTFCQTACHARANVSSAAFPHQRQIA